MSALLLPVCTGADAAFPASTALRSSWPSGCAQLGDSHWRRCVTSSRSSAKRQDPDDPWFGSLTPLSGFGFPASNRRGLALGYSSRPAMQEWDVTKSQQFLSPDIRPGLRSGHVLPRVTLVLSPSGVSVSFVHDNAVRVSCAMMATRHAEKQKVASAVVQEAGLVATPRTVHGSSVQACATPRMPRDTRGGIWSRPCVGAAFPGGTTRKPGNSVGLAEGRCLCSPMSTPSLPLVSSVLVPQTSPESGNVGR